VRRTRDAKNRPRRPAAAMTQVTASLSTGVEDATHRDTKPTE
jgi:hypothetical protein